MSASAPSWRLEAAGARRVHYACPKVSCGDCAKTPWVWRLPTGEDVTDEGAAHWLETGAVGEPVPRPKKTRCGRAIPPA